MVFRDRDYSEKAKKYRAADIQEHIFLGIPDVSLGSQKERS
jgi:hypothetical protein